MFEAGYCRGWVLGWMQGNKNDNYCGKPATLYTLVLIFNAYVRKNPVVRTGPAGEALEAAFIDAFPCPAR